MHRIFEKVSESFVRYLIGSASRAARYYIAQEVKTEKGEKRFLKIYISSGQLQPKQMAGIYRSEEKKLIVIDKRLSIILAGIIHAKVNKDNSRKDQY